MLSIHDGILGREANGVQSMYKVGYDGICSDEAIRWSVSICSERGPLKGRERLIQHGGVWLWES